MNTPQSALLATIILVFIPIQASAQSYYKETTHRCNYYSVNKCKPELRLESKGTFNLALYNQSSYTVDTIWLKARRSGSSNWHEIGKIGKDLTGDDVGIFSFNETFLQNSTGASQEQLKNGFDLRLQIKSVGSGSGLQDKCKVVKVKFSSSNDAWIWQKKDGDSWRIAAVNQDFWFEASGSVNAVKCAIHGVDGSTVTP